MQDIGFAVQLYTVRDAAATDFARTVASVAALGFQHVELAGYGNLANADDVRGALDAAGLTCISAHVPLEQLEANLNQVLEDNAQLDNRHIVLPWIPEERRRSLADWSQLVGLLTDAGNACRERGFQLAYHHHDFELAAVEGQVPFDLIWSQTDPRLVKAQLDVYWLQRGGRNPVKAIRDLGSRVSSIHLKDMDRTPERRFAALGQGVLVFPKILEAASAVGVPWAIVEQDDTYGVPPIDALRQSFDYLRSINRV